MTCKRQQPACLCELLLVWGLGSGGEHARGVGHSTAQLSGRVFLTVKSKFWIWNSIRNIRPTKSNYLNRKVTWSEEQTQPAVCSVLGGLWENSLSCVLALAAVMLRQLQRPPHPKLFLLQIIILTQFLYVYCLRHILKSFLWPPLIQSICTALENNSTTA